MIAHTCFNPTLATEDDAMRFEEYVQHDAMGLAALVRGGEVTSSELLAAAQSRADEVNGQINAIVRRLDQAAGQQAAAADQGAGPLAGVPFLVKDLFQDIQGVVTSYGCRAMAEAPAEADSDVVKRWRKAGLVMFGMTNTPEFGAKGITEPDLFGPTRNPWDLSRTPGGSSGGSAAAVAAGIVPMAGASDGGGSIRIPAAACGLFGMKVGRGRISIGPLMAEGLNGAAVQGVLTRSVRDSALALDIMQGPEAHAPYYMPAPTTPYLAAIQRPPKPLRIGYTVESPIGTAVDPHAKAAVEQAARLLTDLGHHVEPVPLPFNGLQLSEDFLLAWFCSQAMIIDAIREATGARLSAFEADTRLMAAIGRTVSATRLLACEGRWNEHIQALSRYHEQFDLWLSPALAAPPVKVGSLRTPKAVEMVGDFIASLGLAGWLHNTSMFRTAVIQNMAWTPYTQLANLTGRPAMSVPLYWTPEGLPLGVQFVGPLDSEATLLQLAAQLEQAQPWFERRPAL